jgi:hypothetical protein
MEHFSFSEQFHARTRTLEHPIPTFIFRLKTVIYAITSEKKLSNFRASISE